MADLLLHRRPVYTVFDLLGDKEDDITYSFGWALANSEQLASKLLGTCFAASEHGLGDSVTALRLQETLPGAGRTDVEVETERVHLIIEAKRGWTLPSVEQLAQYATRFTDCRASQLLVISECSSEWATPRLPAHVAGVPVHYLAWAEVASMVETVADAASKTAEKRLLREFDRYLRGLMTMQDPQSNMVYVVSLGLNELFGSGMSFADIVVDHQRYFHPMGGGPGGWPKTPPNYVGFRFHGKLQQVCHIESYRVHEQPWDAIPGLAGKPDWPPGPHFLYELGPVMKPHHDVRTGKLFRAQRVWCALDLLLTSSTIAEARDKTNERLAAAGEAA